jgi:hypothetical protein
MIQDIYVVQSKKEKQLQKNKREMRQMENNKRADLHPNMLTVTLTVNALNISIKRHRLVGWMF